MLLTFIFNVVIFVFMKTTNNVKVIEIKQPSCYNPGGCSYLGYFYNYRLTTLKLSSISSQF